MTTSSRFKRGFYSVTKRKPVRIAVAYVVSLVIGILLLKRLSQQGFQDTNSGPLNSTADDAHNQTPAGPRCPVTTKVDQEKVQHERLEKIRNYCNESKNNKNIFHELPDKNHFNFVVSEKHKFIICYVPKTGSSQWKDLLLNILAIRPVTPNHDISLFDHTIFKFLNAYPLEERRKMLDSYQKFFFVREPFERLLSAYRDKFVGKTTQLYENIAKEIVHKVRGDVTEKDNDGKPTFAEFTSYIDQLPDSSTWDMHWRPAHQTCYPCAIDYDYVGYFDTIKEDADYILKKLRLDDVVQFSTFQSQTPVLVETHYSQIPLDRIIRLADFYREDFEMFGYKYPVSIRKLFKDWV